MQIQCPFPHVAILLVSLGECLASQDIGGYGSDYTIAGLVCVSIRLSHFEFASPSLQQYSLPTILRELL